MLASILLGLKIFVFFFHKAQSHRRFVQVHESFRSENVLFYPKTSPLGQHPPSTGDEVDYSEPWLLGFEYSRPELDFSAGFIDIDPSRDVYRHPERQGQPQKLFNKLHDIYALGVVLLEIGKLESSF